MNSLNLFTLDSGNLQDGDDKYLHSYHKQSGPGTRLQGIVGGYILTFCDGQETLEELQTQVIHSVTQPKFSNEWATNLFIELTSKGVSGFLDPYMFKLALSHEKNKFWGDTYPEWLATLWYLLIRGVDCADHHILCNG